MQRFKSSRSGQRFLNVHPLCTTPSTISDIWSVGRPFAASEPKQPPGGKMRLPSHETRFDVVDTLDRTPLP